MWVCRVGQGQTGKGDSKTEAGSVRTVGERLERWLRAWGSSLVGQAVGRGRVGSQGSGKIKPRVSIRTTKAALKDRD